MPSIMNSKNRKLLSIIVLLSILLVALLVLAVWLHGKAPECTVHNQYAANYHGHCPDGYRYHNHASAYHYYSSAYHYYSSGNHSKRAGRY